MSIPILADIAPEAARPSHVERVAAHSNQLLGWGIGLSFWLFLTGVAAVAGVATLLRHAIDPPSARTKRLGLWTAGANGALAIAAGVMVSVLKRAPTFSGFAVDLAAIAWVLAVAHAALAIGNGALVMIRPVVEPDDDAPAE